MPSILRWPPDKLPAGSRRRSDSAGNMAYSSSIRPRARFAGKNCAPIRTFSSTVRPGKPEVSDMNTMPRCTR
jgi:hypothetical protein